MQTGNSHARRALVAGAWASRSPTQVRRQLQLRLEQGPKPISDSNWQAQLRLCQRDRQLSAQGKHATQVVVAIAWDLRACRWAMAQEVSLTPLREPIESPAAVCTRW